MKKILIISKTRSSLEDLTRILSHDPLLDIDSVVGDIAKTQVTLKERSQDDKPDLIVLDYFGDEQKQIEIFMSLHNINPSNKFLVLFPAWMAAFSNKLHESIEKYGDFLYLPQDDQNNKFFKKDLLAKIHELCGADPILFPLDAPPVYDCAPEEIFEVPYTLRHLPKQAPKVLAIGASTGGPKALSQMLSLLNPLPIPILVTQHCGAFFTDALLDMINVYSKMPAILAREGEKLEEGVVYLAPGNHHMGVVSVDGEPQIHLMFTPPENLSRPAIDPMLNSLPEVFSKDILGIILTGMGNDGLLGSKKIIESGGAIFAQDQKTSTVWDMPSKVIRAQFCSFVGSIPELCSKIEEVIVK